MASRKTKPYHLPVMAGEVVKLLVTDREGAYFDLTAGLGGHLKALAGALGPNARLYGLDKDPKAVELATKKLADCSQVKRIVRASFGDLDAVMDRVGENAMDGILLDLGLSSYQLNEPGRGFSFRQDGPLDMRFDSQLQSRTAADLVNSLGEERLVEIIRSFGEERRARRIARAIVRERRKKMIQTTTELADIVTGVIPPPHQSKSLARVFQAFRIAVNGELDQLEAVLPQALSCLKVRGRVAVISYHSLEDRLVKRFFQQETKGCVCPPRLLQCVCGAKPHVRILTRKVITPQAQEMDQNPRARSAKLRVAEKTAA
jgi:16S rRNA (cytosine1402-N4)-methyltransferase